MKSKSQRNAEEDVWGGPAVLLAPGQARPTPARIFSQSSRTNTNPIDRATRRPARGERLRFLKPDRRRTGPIGVGSARRLEAAIFASSIPYLDVSGDSLAARERGRRGSRSLSIQLTLCSSSLSAAQNEPSVL